MMSQSNTAIQQNRSNEDAEIGSKNYQKLKDSIEKEGFREGISDGRDSVFQGSFDNGYEDGFKVGFHMGKNKIEKASRGNCSLCKDPAIMSSHKEEEVRKLHKNAYESITRE